MLSARSYEPPSFGGYAIGHNRVKLAIPCRLQLDHVKMGMLMHKRGYSGFTTPGDTSIWQVKLRSRRCHCRSWWYGDIDLE